MIICSIIPFICLRRWCSSKNFGNFGRLLAKVCKKNMTNMTDWWQQFPFRALTLATRFYSSYLRQFRVVMLYFTSQYTLDLIFQNINNTVIETPVTLSRIDELLKSYWRSSGGSVLKAWLVGSLSVILNPWAWSLTLDCSILSQLSFWPKTISLTRKL